MTETESPARLVGTAPFVWSSDVPAAARYYEEVLGFTIDFTHEWRNAELDRACGLALVSRDDAELQIMTCECPDERHAGLGFFKLEVQEIDRLFEEWRDRGAKMRCEPTDQPWGVRDFTTEDPEGNRIYVFEHR